MDVACPSLVGRDTEWSRLRAALDETEEGHGALTCLIGEAGIGKSRLAAEVSSVARERDLPVLLGRAVDTGSPVPFRPLCEALSGYLRQTEPEPYTELGPLRETLAPLVPQWRRAGADTYRASTVELGEALLRLLTAIAGPRGAVVVLEDLHWADPDTADILEYLGDNIVSTPVMCVATLRPDKTTAALRVVRTLSSRRAATVVELERLTPAQLVEMTELCLGAASLPGDVDDLVSQFSDGLPFLVEELLASAISTGSLVAGSEGWRVETGQGHVIPQGFAELVRRRLAHLSEEEANALSIAAVLGSHFDADLLQTVTGRSPEAVMDTLHHGVEAQILISDPSDIRSFAFRHALTRDALLGQLLLPYERLELSRRVLAALDAHHPELAGPLCELAAMLAEEVGDRVRTAELLLIAARRSHAQGALCSAEPMLERAWHWADSHDGAWLEIGSLLMTVLTERGATDRALEVGERLLTECPDPTRHVDIHLSIARAAATAGRWDDAADAVVRAREAARATSSRCAAAMSDAIAAEVAIGRDRYGEARELATAALAVAEREQDHALECEALLVLGRCERALDVDDAAASFNRVIRIGREQTLPTWGIRGLMERASLEIWNFLPSTELAATREQAAEAGALIVTAHLDNFLAWSARDHWETDLVDPAAHRCIALARKMHLPVLEGVALCASAVAAAQRGERDQMDERITEALATSGDHPEVIALGAVARVTLWLRRDDRIRTSEGLDTAMDHLRGTPSLAIPERGLWALVRAIEDRNGDDAIAELARGPAGNSMINTSYRQYALAVMSGRRGDAAGADHHLTIADGDRPEPAWFQHHARRLVAEAALADGWGDPVTWLRTGLTYFGQRGDDDLASACRTVLTKAGVSAPRRSRGGSGVPPDLRSRGMTAREAEVLELLAEARTTREIASKLYISPKTVERHTANMVSKLGVSGRAGLVAFAASRNR